MFTTASLVLLLSAGQPDTYTLQWKLKEGDTFFNKTTVEMDQNIEAMGQKIDMKITMKQVQRFKVKSVKDGNTVVEMTYIDIKMDAAGLPGFNIGEKLKDVSFTATLNDKFEVKKLEGYDKFLDALGDGDPDQKKLLKAVMPETTVQQVFSQTFVAGPAKPVAVGGTWNRTDKMALGPLGNVESKSAFKLEGVKGDVATIGVKGDFTFKPGDGGDLPFKITKADLKIDKFTGTNTFDMKVGRLSQMKAEMEVSGSMTIEVAGNTVDAKLVQKVKTVGVVSDKNPIVD